jgi:Transposase DDE domain group 1
MCGCPDCGVLNGKVLLAWENGSVQITFRSESRSTFRVKRTGSMYPLVRVDSTRCKAVGQAGGVLLTTTVGLAGIDRLLSTALSRWRKPLAVHDPGKIITDLALSLALGGDCLADVALLRSEPGVYGPVASDPTVSRLIGVLAADVAAVVKAINTARAAARARVWALAGDRAPDHARSATDPLILDVDATLVTSHSDKQHAAPTFKRGSARSH